MVTRYYIDTSVFGGYFDVEFEDATHQLFEKISKEGIKILYSELTENELENAPEKIKTFIRGLTKDSIEYTRFRKNLLNWPTNIYQKML
jgi:predicted nucleic acid-binding protein